MILAIATCSSMFFSRHKYLYFCLKELHVVSSWQRSCRQWLCFVFSLCTPGKSATALNRHVVNSTADIHVRVEVQLFMEQPSPSLFSLSLSRSNRHNFLQLTALGDLYRCRGLSTLRSNTLDLVNDIKSINNLAEDNVLAIEPGSINGADEDCSRDMFGGGG